MNPSTFLLNRFAISVTLAAIGITLAAIIAAIRRSRRESRKRAMPSVPLRKMPDANADHLGRWRDDGGSL